jgi:hypothetical protein
MKPLIHNSFGDVTKSYDLSKRSLFYTIKVGSFTLIDPGFSEKLLIGVWNK